MTKMSPIFTEHLINIDKAENTGKKFAKSLSRNFLYISMVHLPIF